MLKPLADRIALVTGSAHRVGKAIALELAARGAHLVIHYHGSDAAEAERTVQEIEALGVQAMCVRADQSDPGQVNALFDAAKSHFGRLDVLVNSASIFERTDFLSLTPQAWQRVLDVNLTGPFLCSQAAARLMLAQQPAGGVIVNIVDNSAVQPWATYPHHSVSKAGLHMLTKVLARALAPDIRVNAVAPGPVLKEPTRSDESWDRLAQRLPLRRTGSPADVARAVAFLAGEPFITGAVLHVDGGEALTDSGASDKPRA